jgi:hypothetical protein
MTNLAVDDVSASLDHFEPIHVSDSLIRLRNRSADCVLNARFRRTDDFEYFVDVIFHFVLVAGVSQKNRPAEESRKALIRLDRRDHTHVHPIRAGRLSQPQERKDHSNDNNETHEIDDSIHDVFLCDQDRGN